MLLAGCGDRPVDVPQVTAPAAPQGFHQVTYPSAGVRLDAPKSWPTTPQSAPLVTVINSHAAVIALWRYPRSGSLPNSGAQLQQVSRRLVSNARRRQANLRVLGASARAVDGRPTVELDAIEPLGPAVRRVRSLHIFTDAAEVVLEEYAPLRLFARVDRQVFRHVLRSLVVLSR